MNRNRHHFLAAGLLLAWAAAAPALAASHQGGHGGHGAHGDHGKPAAQAAAAELVDGEVRRIDKEGAKLTLKHGDIKSLDMPAMTMAFHVKDKAMLEPLKTGDTVKFKAVKDGGRYVITEMQVVAKP